MAEIIIRVVIVLIIALIGAYFSAQYIERRHEEAYHEEVEEERTQEAYETIQEAKTWLEVNSMEENSYMGDVLNKHSVRELATLEPTEEDYKEFVGVIADKVKELYEDFRFGYFEPGEEDLTSGYFMQFNIFGHDDLYEELYVQAMDKGIDENVVNDYFFEKLKAGEVIPVGDKIEFERDGTGISPVTTGDDIRIIITFVTDEYQAKREEDEANER